MKGALTIIAFFVLGVMLGWSGALPLWLSESDFTLYALFFLLFCVGVSVGADDTLRRTIARMQPKILLIPLATIVGTLLGSFAISFALDNVSATESMAIGSGFGYYSLSSIFITQYKGAELGTIALVSNVFREIFALLMAPLLFKAFGKLAPIAAGGATTMDTTLPVISRVCGRDWIFVAMLHGFAVDLSVPFLVTFLCRF
ncbi:lysine exporter LysO family protein [Craterilacuibacter sinensis]|uniref:DUF340 domain-containing protein n=1 Tax=Craterilacuibacter sinensis TaxID=2686017 RepID=A0A845BRK3_9NEIS|nr:lysine exporter LysO family protein [Craterilacuibacter sinensis]MXR37788.1 DUF340 domain-containing protein [Craterilacuibacter sinensis]RQW25334.1 lysine exporter LysO family protein [Rhodobacteraceae bacterium CH30]